MLKAKDFRQRAWGKLSGQWGTMALITLLYLIITGALGGATFAIAILIIGGPLLMGMINSSLTVVRNNTVKVETLFSGFYNFVNAMVLYIINTVLVGLWSLLLVIPGIVKWYSYSMSYYILADNPQMGANDARLKSMELMKGNKWRLFCLHFSFIGWFILCGITFGILTFWVMPYVHTATAEFYQNLVHKDVEYMAQPANNNADNANNANVDSTNSDSTTVDNANGDNANGNVENN
jgi:uncharacterized membrane protein